jgi:hypothetical protein
LTPASYIAALNASVGNYQTSRLIAGAARARQLQRIAVTMTAGRVSSVTYDTGRPRGNIAGHQGDHTTAFVTFKSMVRNNVMGKTLVEAKAAMLGVLDEVMLFPGAAVKVGNTEYLFNKADVINASIRAVTNENELAAVMHAIVEIRNELGLSAEKHARSSGGHGEAGNNALLEECDDRLRNGGPALRYTVPQMVDAMWSTCTRLPSPTHTSSRPRAGTPASFPACSAGTGAITSTTPS